MKEFKDLFGPLLTSADDLSQKETDFPLSKQDTDNQSFKRLKSLGAKIISKSNESINNNLIL